MSKAFLPLLILLSCAHADQLTTTLRQIARDAGGTVGIAITHIEDNQQLSINGDQRFPMGSVVKLPTCILVLRAADNHRISLEDRLTLGPADMSPGFSPLAAEHPMGGITLTLRDLVKHSLSISDNTAHDALLRRIGGPAVADAQLHALGYKQITIGRYATEMAADYEGVTIPSNYTLQRFNEAAATVRPDERRTAIRHFANNPLTSATPNDTTRLLAQLEQGRLLTPASTALALQLLTDTPAGSARLRGLLPPTARVAHKTGSWDGAALNDVGIITLPDDTHLAIAVYIKESPETLARQEAVIARIARAAYDAFIHTE
jgi:beta-lactamase class A